jgi:hypothetical protein
LSRSICATAPRLVNRLAQVVGMFRVGRALFIGGGPDFIREIRKRGAEVFLDLKLLDSPQQVLPHCRRGDPFRCRLRRRRRSHLARGRANPRGARNYRRPRARLAQQSPALV